MNSRSDLCNRSRSQTLITIAAKKIPGGRGVLRKRKGREPNLNCFGRVASLSATTTQKCESVLQIATKERARRNDQPIEVRLTVVAHWAIRTLLIPVEPVKVNFLTIGLEVISSPISEVVPVHAR